MKKFLILMISVGILSCANNKTEQVSTIKIKDEKAQKISKMMESYTLVITLIQVLFLKMLKLNLTS